MSTRSAAFDRLEPRIQRWIWRQQWSELRDAQETAIEPILSGRDIVIAAGTASGKTEAAYFPILTRILANGRAGIRSLYVSPLKALINDQFERLELLCESLDIPVTRWHGDAPGSVKRRLLNEPRGLLLITPESLEAMCINHGPKLATLFDGLEYVVIDELHSFIDSERGRQVQSLCKRLELALHRSVPRAGLSATLGDMQLAAEYLRHDAATEVFLVQSDAAQEIQLQVRGYLSSLHGTGSATENPEAPDDDESGSEVDIAEHLFRTLRGTRNLVFANSRLDVERYSDLLRRISERRQLPNQFWPHHGSLSKELRLDAEAAFKREDQPVTIVCTSTLEMGIDIGDVESVAQISAPFSVSSMRQRLGRSGRRGAASVLRLYLHADEPTATSNVEDLLCVELVQTIAMVELLRRNWCEPPLPAALHLSTLVQQSLSLIAQSGGITASSAWKALCARGPFRAVDQARYATFLRDLAAADLISQTHDSVLVLGLDGERLVNHYDFYAAFTSGDEFRVVHHERTLGQLPVTMPLVVGGYIVFAGRRWIVSEVLTAEQIIRVETAPAGRPPMFTGAGGGEIHDVVRREMEAVYRSHTEYAYVNAAAKRMLCTARETFRSSGLSERPVVRDGEDAVIFPWRGDRILNTLGLVLRSAGIETQSEACAIRLPKTSVEVAANIVRDLSTHPLPTAVDLASVVQNKFLGKHSVHLSEPLLCDDYASMKIDVLGCGHALTELSARFEARP